MKILCVCPIGIGNYLMTYPACHALKATRPDLSLHLLGLRLGVADFASGDPLWSGVHVFDPTRIWGNLPRQLSILTSLRREGFSASLNFFPSNKWMYNLLPVLAGVPRRHAFRYCFNPLAKLSFLCTDRIDVDSAVHDARQNMRLAAAFIGRSDVARLPFRFPVLFDARNEKWAHETMRRLSANRLIAIHPGSSAEHGMVMKRWAPECFARLADRICDRLGTEAVVLGGQEEQSLKQAVASAMSTRCHVLPQAALKDTAAFLSMCTLCLCNDSGLMHIAACAGTPTVAVFGPTDEGRNGPVGSACLVVRSDVPGFPLWTASNVGNRRAPKGIDPKASLEALTPEQAWAQVLPWFENAGLP